MKSAFRKFRLPAVIGGAALVISAVAAQPAQAADSLIVRDFQLTSAVDNREPVDSIQTSVVNQDKVYAYARIENQGYPTHVVAVWYYGNQRHASVPLNVGTSPGWRTWSSANLAPGDWRVELVDRDGNVLTQTSFTVGERSYGMRDNASSYDYEPVSSSSQTDESNFYPMQ